MQHQSPILRGLPALDPTDLTEREHVDLMLAELAEVAQRHLPHLSHSNPWHQAGVEIQRQASETLGRRRVRLASGA